MRYKVGDKVVIRKDLESGRCYDGCYTNKEMSKLKGTIQTVSAISPGLDCMVYDVDDFAFVDEMIDHEATEKLKNPTPKQLLKSGDKVTYRNGDERWVLVETGSIHDESGNRVSGIKNYDDNLFQSELISSGLDIMKIERGTELIWEREEKSAKQIEIESIENEMKKLAERLEQVRKEM